MTPTRKGLYYFCEDCIFKQDNKSKYPCTKSHREVRRSAGVKYEREFTMCYLKIKREEVDD